MENTTAEIRWLLFSPLFDVSRFSHDLWQNDFGVFVRISSQLDHAFVSHTMPIKIQLILWIYAMRTDANIKSITLTECGTSIKHTHIWVIRDNHEIYHTEHL